MYRTREQAAAYLFILPSFVSFIIFVLVPAVMGLGLSFFQWDLVSPIQFVGMENWSDLLENKEALGSIKTTIILVIISLPLTVICGLILALLVNKLPFGKTFFRSVFFIPSITSMVAMSVIWGNMYSKDIGLINYVLSQVGIQPVGWLSNPHMALISIVILGIWSSAGYNMLIFLAGLQGIDESLYEAAKVDGGGGFYIFWKITLPLLSPTLFFISITSIIGGLQSFEAVYLLTGGGPGYATTTLVYFIVNAAFKSFNMGLAATISLVLFMLILLVTLIQWRFQKKWVHYD
ncbi:ABC transporter permease [Paenibacillus baekrokdamisoli]|uniref:ABC transporter permease n=2 Tax=Paenibacillus baekrokdamisoli TaxID=1712516 RepID=A0A3G9IUK6_9BACL|nr:sugar ABC transporter permease [Paenibacillus baekrokdamisoli]BBH19725.1 ABC transporter permease [Paenibacillus baekrokdamisoli]